LSVIPDVVSGTLPFTFSTLVVFVVAESAEVLVLLLLLQAIRQLVTMANRKSFFM